MKEKIMMRQSFIWAFLSVTLLCSLTLVEGGHTVRCSFNNNHCQWRENGRKHCWRVSLPGESLAGMTSYLYFDKSCSKSSEIKTKPDSGFFTKGEEELHFWYYMHGEGDGDLYIVSHDALENFYGIPPQVAFHCKGDRGNQWSHAHVKIPSIATYMGIIANTTGSFSIAIDNITADSHGGTVPKKQTCQPIWKTSKRPSRITTVANVKTTANIQRKTTTKKNTAINTKSPSLTTKSKRQSESTTHAQKERSTTIKAITSGRPIWPGFHSPAPEFIHDVHSDKGESGNTSVIVGSCVGGIVLLVGAVLAVVFAYRRYHMFSMYSFKKKELIIEEQVNY